MLNPVAATNEALHAQLNDLRKDLSQAHATAALLGPETARADEAQASWRRLESAAASSANQLSKLEDKLRYTEQKLQEAQGMEAHSGSLVAVACVSTSMLVYGPMVVVSVKLSLLPNLVPGSHLKHWDMCISLRGVLQSLCNHAVARLLENSVSMQKIMLGSCYCLLSTRWQVGC